MNTLIIGAGMAGLRAAALLREAGHHVTVVDKGRRHGGRMATRRVDDAVFDTGVLDLAASTASLRAELEAAATAGHAALLGPDAGSGATTSGAPRWRGAPMMRSLPTTMAERAATTAANDGAPSGTVHVRLATTVTAMAVRDGRWVVTIAPTGANDDAPEELTADAVVLTAPAPQSVALLRTSDGVASEATLAQLDAVTYAPCLTVLTRPVDRAVTDLQRHDHESQDDALARVHDNGRTGASPVMALTLQPNAAFSTQHLDGDRDAAAAILAEQASARIGTTLEVVHVHGWRYAQVESGIDLPALRDDTSGVPLVLAGDLFTSHDEAPPRADLEGVERAYLSGTAAAALLVGGPAVL